MFILRIIISSLSELRPLSHLEGNTDIEIEKANGIANSKPEQASRSYYVLIYIFLACRHHQKYVRERLKEIIIIIIIIIVGSKFLFFLK